MADFEAGSIFIAFRSATDQLRRGFRQARSLFSRMGVAANALRRVMSRAAARINRAWLSVSRTIGRVALAMKIALGIATVASVKWASEGVEATNKMNVVFGEHADIVAEFAKTSARSFAIASKDAKGYAATLGQILIISGETQESAAEMSVQILKLAADMASFDEVSIEEALTKIRSGLVGEVEPLRRVGILLSEAAVQAKAVELGLGGANDELTDMVKVQVRLALIMDQSTDRLGDFTRTSREFANSLRIVRAQLIEIGTKLGGFLLPILTKGLNKLKAILDVVPLIIDEIGGLTELGNKFAGGAAATLQAIISTATTLLTAAVNTFFTFMSKSADKLIKLLFKGVVAIAGPSAIKIGRLVLEKMKATVAEGLILLGGPFRWAVDQINNLLRIADVKLSEFTADAKEKAADVLALLPKSIRGAFLIANLRKGAQVARDTAAVIKQDVLTVEQVTAKSIARTDALIAAVAADTLEATNKVKAEIDAIETGLLESGVLKDVTDEAVALLKSGLDIASKEFRAAMEEIAERFGLDVDVILARIKALQPTTAEKISALFPDLPREGPTTPTAAPLDPKVVKQIEELGKVTREAIASSVAGGIADGVLEGKKAIAILADIGRRLFRNAFNAAVLSFQKALETAIEESSIKAQALLSGVLNAAVAIVGLLLSQLDRGSDASRRFGRLGAEVESSQLVRGVVAGPTNVAIAEVGENLKRALATTEEILRQSLFVQTEMRDRMGGRGNGINSTPTAGITPTVAP